MCDLETNMIERIVSDLISSNVFVLSKNDSCIIIDAGAKIDSVKKAVGDKKVEGIFLTHGHYDHSARVMDYIHEFGTTVYASEFTKEYLQNSAYNYSEGKFAVSDFSNFKFLSGNGCLELPSFSVQFHQLGGHSKSDMMFKVGDDIFVGDVLIGRDMGRIDLYGGSKEKMSESLKFLQEVEYETMHSGHGNDNDKKTQDKVANLWLRFLSR